MTPTNRVARGLAWSIAHQLVEVALAFLAMLVLVRIIPPEEYGRWTAVLGILAVLNALGFAGFAAQALQVAEFEEPDWSLHFSVGLYIQGPLMLACHALGALCRLSEPYRPIAPLLHLAAFGLILDWPAQLRAVMLRREMDFRRLKILMMCSTLLKLATTLILGVAGAGAYALVLGANVVTAVPLAVDLLAVRRWRPRRGWWHWPDWAAYEQGWRFGLQQAGSGILGSLRGGLEAAVLPYVLGYGSMGLLDRARAMFGGTVGRAGHILVETLYPLLPQSATDRIAFARRATAFVQVLCFAVVPSAVFMGLEGPRLSRLLYGSRWTAADPLIWPAALGGIALAMFGAGSGVLLARSRLRICLALDVGLAAVSVPMLAIAWTGAEVTAYAWAIATGQLAAAAAALRAASPLLASGWTRSALSPPIVGSVLAGAAVVAVRGLEPVPPLGAALLAHTAVYGVVLAAVLRGLYPVDLAGVLSRMPGGRRLSGWLRLPVVTARESQ